MESSKSKWFHPRAHLEKESGSEHGISWISLQHDWKAPKSIQNLSQNYPNASSSKRKKSLVSPGSQPSGLSLEPQPNQQLFEFMSSMVLYAHDSNDSKDSWILFKKHMNITCISWRILILYASNRFLWNGLLSKHFSRSHWITSFRLWFENGFNNVRPQMQRLYKSQFQLQTQTRHISNSGKSLDTVHPVHRNAALTCFVISG